MMVQLAPGRWISADMIRTTQVYSKEAIITDHRGWAHMVTMGLEDLDQRVDTARLRLAALAGRRVPVGLTAAGYVHFDVTAITATGDKVLLETQRHGCPCRGVYADAAAAVAAADLLATTFNGRAFPAPEVL